MAEKKSCTRFTIQCVSCSTEKKHLALACPLKSTKIRSDFHGIYRYLPKLVFVESAKDEIKLTTSTEIC